MAPVMSLYSLCFFICLLNWGTILVVGFYKAKENGNRSIVDIKSHRINISIKPLPQMPAKTMWCDSRPMGGLCQELRPEMTHVGLRWQAEERNWQAQSLYCFGFPYERD